MIQRQIQTTISSKLKDKKALIILGPRQTGKTTLLKQTLNRNEDVLWVNGDDPLAKRLFEGASLSQLKRLIGRKKFIAFDEAQRIKNIGLVIKLIVDNIDNVKVLATGSSAFELANEVNEPLTGRKWGYHLYPVSWKEYSNYAGNFEANQHLQTRIIYGMYPEVITATGEEEETLKQIASSYLYKDLLSLKEIRKPDLLEKLLHAIALQLGNEVSLNELSSLLGVDKKTVSQYLQLLEKVFIIFQLNSLSRNMRSEIMRSRKIYFYDTGIRNAIINNYNDLSNRTDKGVLWENFLIAERIKKHAYARYNANYFFWRTHRQQEIDFIEERNGKFSAFEFKWNSKRNFRFHENFIKNYNPTETKVITEDNFEEWLL